MAVGGVAIVGRIVLLIGLALGLSAAPAALEKSGAPRTATGSEALARLTVPAQAAVSRVLGRVGPSYGAVRSARGFGVWNERQGLTAEFNLGGVQVGAGEDRLGFSLRGYGRGAQLVSVVRAAPEAERNRVVYRHGSFSEWWVNGPLGLEQGFTVRAPPHGDRAQTLTLALDLSGTLRPTLTAGRDGLTFAGSSVRYTGLTASDARGHEVSTWLELRGGTLLLRVDDQGASYPLTIDPFIQQAKLGPSDASANDYFGDSVSVSGDTIVTGTFNKNSGTGAVYVFSRPAGGWANGTQTAKLTASDGAAGDYLGGSVAISGDTIVAGAFGDDGHKGAVYVFVKPVGGWADSTQTAKLTASDGVGNPAGADQLGYPVAIDGDTVVASGGGRVYVFVKPASGWANGTQTAKVSVSPTVSSPNFGSLAISNDTVVAGIWSEEIGGNQNAGAAYVFVRPAGGWVDATQTAKLTSSAPTAYDSFGQSVAISADTIIAGEGAGANVFVKPAGGWVDANETAKLTGSDADGSFGVSVSVSGDKVAVGADSTDSTGAVYAFAKPAGGWVDATETQKLTPSDAVAGDLFGVSVATTGDTIVAGAEQKDNNAGAVYVFGTPAGPPVVGITKTQQDCTPSCGAPTSSPISADFHDTIRYQVTVSNTGGSPASNILVQDLLPGGFGPMQVLSPVGVSCTFGSAPNTRGSNQIGCTMPTIAAGSSTVITIVAVVELTPSPCTIVGTSGDDTIVVPSGGGPKPKPSADKPAVVCGLGGSDTITGAGADDLIYGDTPSNFSNPDPEVNTAWIDTNRDRRLSTGELQANVSATILTGIGAGDTIHGAAGNDTIYGQEGHDVLYGDDGNDSIHGAEGNDEAFGGPGGDAITGGDGVDRMAGGDGPDSIVGNAGNDLLLGQAGNDSLEGAGGTDRVDGGSGNDTVNGGGPTVNGGPPPPNTINNVLSGGAGSDTCSYGPIATLATRTDRGDIRGTSCEDPKDPKSQKTTWNGSAYTFSYRDIDDHATAHAIVFDWDAFDGTPLP